MSDLETRIAALISAKLGAGLLWPGDPENGVPAQQIGLPAFTPGVGMPKEMTDLINTTATMIGEAIVHLIKHEGACELISRDDAERLTTMETRQEGGRPFERPVPIHCRCDQSLKNPLTYLTITDNHRIVVDGTSLIGGLSALDERCPHHRKQG